MNFPARRNLLILSVLFLGLVALSTCDRIVGVDSVKEEVLKQDLFSFRQIVDQYTLDHQKTPSTLEDLLKSGYLKSIPVGSFTGRRDWGIDPEPKMQDPPRLFDGGAVGVHARPSIDL